MLVAVMSFGFAGLYYMFKYDDGKSIRAEMQTLNINKEKVKAEIDNLKLEVSTLQETDKVMNQMGLEINQFLEFIPKELTSSKILNNLNNTARNSGVNIENIINSHSFVREDFYEKIKVSLVIKGVFSQLLVFLSKLTSLRELITVESFTMESMARQNRRAAFGELKMRMDMYSYRYIENLDKTAAGG